jgi:hypothetical protein
VDAEEEIEQPNVEDTTGETGEQETPVESVEE